MSRSPGALVSRVSLGLAALVLAILAGTALALWIYLRGPVASDGPEAPPGEQAAPSDAHALTRGDPREVARTGG
jgi:hypothetical protein